MKMPLKTGFHQMDPIHFYCVQLYTTHGAMHFHLPMPKLLDADACLKMCDRIKAEGHATAGDDPQLDIAFSFKPEHIIGVMIEHKVSYTRAEMEEYRNRPEPGESPLTGLMRRMSGGSDNGGGMN